MENSKVEVKVNVINQLKLLRQSTFKDKLCFLDEDVQNAQRAKATEVRITTDAYNNTITIENNGTVLENPQALFSVAESSWDDDVMNSENPFGMGFFSNIAVSNLLIIHTGDKIITFDVDNMMKTMNTEVQVEETDDFYDGFKLILNNAFESVSCWDVRERVKILGKYIHELDIYLDDVYQEKKSLTEGDGSDYLIKLEEDMVTGWISLGGKYSYWNHPKVFYKGRLVTELNDLPYLNGDLHVGDKTLNLTSPDRKDIIKDEKLTDFIALIRAYVEEYCNNLALSGENLDEVSETVSYYANLDKIASDMKFATFHTSKENILYLKGIVLAKKLNKDIESFEDYELYLEESAAKQSEEHCNEITLFSETEERNTKEDDNVADKPVCSNSEGIGANAESVTDKNRKRLSNKVENLFTDSDPVFYVDFAEIDRFEHELDTAKLYDLRIAVARNKVELDALKKLADQNKVFHISSLQEDVHTEGTLSNTELSGPERRAMMILNMISEICGFDHNVFAIGDLMVTKTIHVQAINACKTIIDDTIIALTDKEREKIYVDRSAINKKKLNDNASQKLGIHDYQFILANFTNITRQMGILKNCSTEKCAEELFTVLGNCR